MKNGGPVGAPGMPEWGHLPIPRKLRARRDRWQPRRAPTDRGFVRLYESHVMQANHGCDFDFLLGGSPVVGTARTYG